MHIHPIPAFSDNYIWCLVDQGKCALVDPGDAAPALAYIREHNLQLTDILITHHHADHIGGLKALLQVFPEVSIFGADSGRIPHVTEYAIPGKKVTLNGLPLTFDIIDVPGHTRDHIAYYGEAGLFCGDTLFSAGCGRLFEGTPAQMLNSLNKLMALPEHTPVYCTHEYTLANVAFALAVEPNNQALIDYAGWAKSQRSKDVPTLPSSIAEQKAINPFLRTSQMSVVDAANQQLGHTAADETAVFAAIRGWKDNF